MTVTKELDTDIPDALPITEEQKGNVFQDENIPPFVATTPTTNRIKNILGLRTPSTPKHRVRLAGLPLTPSTPRSATPRSKSHNAFAAARQLFTQSGSPTRLVGRDSERTQIHDFIDNAIAARSGGCTYVSGPPGTGKSAFVQDVINQFAAHEDVEIATINCVSLRTSADIYARLLQEFAPNATIGRSSLKQYLSKLFLSNSRSKSRLVLLDEIDNLLDTDCDVLYTIFEWAMHRSSSLILIGIANALDLTDRFLPRLKARGLKPQLLPFLPYTGAQISNIISDKLRTLLPKDAKVEANFVPFMHPAAIQLCGKKIASQTGDLRKAFSLVRRVLEQLEKETREKQEGSMLGKKPLGEVANPAQPSQSLTPEASPLKQTSEMGDTFKDVTTPETAPRATIAHVARMASSIFNNGTTSRLAGLNLQQKAVLCSLVSNERKKAERDPYATPSKSSRKAPSVKELFAKYSLLCKRDEGLLQPLTDTEFRDVVASLETLGLVHEQRGNGSSLLTPTNTPSRSGRSNDDKQIVSAVSEQEMRESLSGAGGDLLRRLLDEA